MRGEGSPDELIEERLALLALQLEGALHHRPGGAEEDEGRCEREEEQPTAGDAFRAVPLVEGGRELLAGDAEWRRQGLDRDRAAVGEVPEQ